jgi:hypothetical protein
MNLERFISRNGILSITQALLFLAFLIITSYYSQFAADDYHFIGELKMYSPHQIYQHLYFEWHGRWTSNFLLVHFLDFYKSKYFLFIFNLATFSALLISTLRLLKSINTFYQFSFNSIKLYCSTIVAVSIFFFCTVTPNETWFWFTSSVIYIWSIIAFIIAIPAIIKVKRTIIDYGLFVIGCIFIGGSNEPLAIISTLFLLFSVIKKQKKSLFIIGLILLNSSLLLNYLSPGTIHRDDITPSLGFIDLILYTGYSSIKFLLFSIHQTFIPAILLSIPFYILGGSIRKTDFVFKPKIEIVYNLLFIISIVSINQLIVVYALGGLSPDRSGISSSIAISILITRFVFLLGNQHQNKYRKVHYLIIINIVGLVALNFYYGKVHNNYATATKKRIEIIKNDNQTIIIVKPLPNSGFIYSAEITEDSKHFKNVHLKSGLGIKQEIVLQK